MYRRSLLAALPVLLSSTPIAWAANVSVVATFSILADMTRTVAGGDATVSSLVPVNGDAHVWEPRPADLRMVQVAKVLVQNGLGLEGWMTRLPQAAGFSGLLVTTTTAVTPRKMTEEGQTITDPHAWQDPRNGVLYVRAIADGLSNALPAKAAAIQTRAQSYIAQIEETGRWIEKTLSVIPQENRRILTSHDAFGYYGARYGIELLSVQGISTESEPSAHDIATLVGQIKKEKIKAVFVENMTNSRLAATVARESGAKLGATVYSDALSAAHGPADTYLRMLRHNTTQFAAAMTV